MTLRVGRRSLGFLVGAAASLVVAAAATRAAAPATVVVLPTTGIVDASMAGYLASEIGRAADEGDAAVVVKLDTPGGSLDATWQITETFLEARVPVIVWVAPAGGRAASAGTFITLAANLAYMAPGTNIGAASPIDSSGADITGTLGQKVLNDAIAKITSIAQLRGRPVSWAVSTVANASSYPAADAVAAGAVDGIAGSLDALLAAADGRTVSVGGSPVVLHLAGAATVERGMNPLAWFLHEAADPNVAFVLFVLGVLGIAVEFLATNLLSGTLGAIAIVLAFVGFGSLPLNVAGLVIIVLGIGLLVLEIHVPSHGLLTLGAGACMALGAGVLYSGPDAPGAPSVAVAWPLIAMVVGVTVAFGILVSFTAMRIRRMPASPRLVGSLQFVGEAGLVHRPVDPLGSVLAAGEEWSARSTDGSSLSRGTRVRVVGRDGLVLLVEKTLEPATPDLDTASTQPVARPGGVG
jgi:membrane-bound serine protease (ClpP class)